jgi:hypothetical protein
MSGNDDSDESIDIFLRRATHVDVISSEIALRLAEMLFARHYSQEHANEQLPLVVVDRGDRWEVHGREGAPQRLKTVIKKADGRILKLVADAGGQKSGP